jgi:signal recognition particle GTPase
MLIIESWLDSHPWKINERDLKRFSNYEKLVEQTSNRLNENEIKTLVSKTILDELDEKLYHPNLGVKLSETISKNLRKQLIDKYKFYKIIIQTFVGPMSNKTNQNFNLYTSYHFDQRTDKYLSVIENNGHM